MFNRIKSYIRTVKKRDPAAKSTLEVLLCYPGLHALAFHRMNHWLWKNHLRLIARFLSSTARVLTGIEIHPAAHIGKHFFIDHGMGVVIGETTKIGDNVTLYHGVTLGGTQWEHGIRHPQIGNDVVVGAGAKLLGPIHIGNGARIGSNAVVVKDVAAEATVIGIPARRISDSVGTMDEYEPHFSAYGTPNGETADPLVSMMEAMEQEIVDLQARLKRMEQGAKSDPTEEELMVGAIHDIKH